MIRQIALIGGLALALAASACSPGQVTTTVTEAQRACVTIAPIVAGAAVMPDPRVQSIVGYANAFCGPLAAGVTPATLDSNTPQWLGHLAGMLIVLAPVALSLL
jgi:hypothetical protein